jgi:hypothetical protein
VQIYTNKILVVPKNLCTFAPSNIVELKNNGMNNIESSKGEIVMYQPDETIRLEVRVEDETVWLNRQQIASLFDRDVKTIGKHINNALQEELDGESVVAKFATTAKDGKTYQVEYYDLDMIMSYTYHATQSRPLPDYR